MKKEKPKNLKLLLCALSGSVVIGGCSNAKVNKSVKKEAQSASNIEKTIENNNEISTNEYKEIETTQHNEITEPETKTEVQTEMHTEVQTEVQTEAPTKKLTATGKKVYGYSDEDKIFDYVNEIGESLINGTLDDGTIKKFLIEQVDFMFYNEDICGIYFDSITTFTKEGLICYIANMSNYLESNYPGLIESLPENYSIILRVLGNNKEQFEASVEEKKCSDRLEMIEEYADLNKEKSK